MDCIWSKYIHRKEDIDELVEFAGKTKYNHIAVVKAEFRDLADVVTFLENYIARKSIPWVGVFF